MAAGKKRKTWIWLLLGIAIIAIGAAVFTNLTGARRTGVQVATGSYTVGRGDVDVTITSSGTLEVEDTTDISLPDGIEIETIFVNKGDLVSEGEVLATLDSASLQYRAAELSGELTELDNKLGSRKTTSTITAPVKGRVKYLPVSEDDDVVESVNKYGSLAILSTDDLMQIEVRTGSVLSLNADVTVKWNGGSEDGTVASRIEDGYLITLDDGDAPYLATADVYSDSMLVGSGTIQIHAPVAIFGNGGTIEKVHYKVDDSISANSTLFTLDNEPATDSYRQTLADRTEKAAQLQMVLMYQNSPNVVASTSGVVSDIQVSEGKKTASSDDSGEVTAFTLGTGGAIKMTVNVDELDINHVAVGQSATITLDAFSTEGFTATVTRISHIGEASGSITTYQTDLLLPYDARLMEGMNGSAVILADSAKDVLLVPLSAIHEDENGSYVNVLGGISPSKSYIKTGLSDGANAEVVSGLNEGDRIEYTASSSSDETASGGFGGGMPQGGPFSRTGGTSND